MPTIVVAEHFGLTPAIREQVTRSVSLLSDVLPEETQVRVFLGMDAKKAFTALFRLHVRQREIVCEESAENLYAAISRAAHVARKKLVKVRRVQIGSRRKPHEDAPQSDEV